MQSSVQGTVVHIRKISKKLAFFDIEIKEPGVNIGIDSLSESIINENSQGDSFKRISAVFKSWECGDS